MKKRILSIIMFSLFMFTMTGFIFAQNAEEIVNKVRTKTVANSVATRSEMQVKKGETTMAVLEIDQFSSKDKNGLQRMFIRFLKPANAKGTRFLMLEKKDGTVDQRIFLPSVGKVQRLVAKTSGDESFMGTDFSSNDIAFLDRKTSLDTYTLLKEENFAGKNCYVIEATPKDKNYSYSKTIMWIEKENSIVLKTEFYGATGEVEKVMEFSNYKNISGSLTPHTTKLSNVKAGSSSTINIKRIEYGTNIPEKIFTLRYLETGK